MKLFLLYHPSQGPDDTAELYGIFDSEDKATAVLKKLLATYNKDPHFYSIKDHQLNEFEDTRYFYGCVLS